MATILQAQSNITLKELKHGKTYRHVERQNDQGDSAEQRRADYDRQGRVEHPSTGEQGRFPFSSKI
jgi:hypothetical protein